MAFRLETCHGRELSPHVEALGDLRITVFREFPYLYEGTREYEHDYLQVYLDTPESIVVLAWEGDQLVGATTGLPMARADVEFQKPFLDAGEAIDGIFYLGESVVLAGHRGQGLGKTFFDLREAHAARHAGLSTTTFCAVDRPLTHPQRPQNYRPLDGFWKARGYQKRTELQARFDWREVGQQEESNHSLTFWTRSWPTR